PPGAFPGIHPTRQETASSATQPHLRSPLRRLDPSRPNEGDLDEKTVDPAAGGGPGEDTADYSAAGAAVLVNLSARTASGGAGADTLVAIENAVGSGFADQILGSAGPNKIFGGLGNDQLIGNSGDDRILGGGGDTLQGNAGSDSLLGGSGNDSASGGIGIDSCEAEARLACEF
ncbi:MAG: Hemolysin-type calcium-binding region, partial [Acidobacteria bacterium]|nr:Hemolysin-type calcium-binding region [Acidobacteriota bacterium]